METIQTGFDHLLRENPIGEARKDALRLNFDRRLKPSFMGPRSQVTEDCLPTWVQADSFRKYAAFVVFNGICHAVF